MEKIKAAIIGSGNIGTDLMVKLRKSQTIELTSMIGIDPSSEGLARAKRFGYEVFDNGLDGFMKQPELADILFDATSAKAHMYHAKVLLEAGKQVLDLTPAAIGPFVAPAVNLGEHIDAMNVNMITCGGQATIPIVHAVNQISRVEYAEIVATISSKSAGPGTRANIDEFTETTARGIERIGGAARGKAIIILNPAEPPIINRDTIYCLVEDGTMDQERIVRSIESMVEKVQEYVPGYRLKSEPIFEGNKVTVFIEVEGAGHYLPKYSGNLDIMTASAAKVAQEMAKYKLEMKAQTN